MSDQQLLNKQLLNLYCLRKEDLFKQFLTDHPELIVDDFIKMYLKDKNITYYNFLTEAKNEAR